MARLSENFAESEFKCPHRGIPTPCPPKKINMGLIHLLEALRCKFGDKPIIIISGYRCPIHNRNVGGAKQSQHLYGNAADIKIAGVTPQQIAAEAEKLMPNSGGIGWGATKCHVDVRTGRRDRWRY